MTLLHRYADGTEVRGIDEKGRTATFVASTERPVPMGWGAPEVLRMSGVDLTRYRANPVVLNSHGRFSVESILGTATVARVGRELHATVHFDETPEGEAAWVRVKSGSLRALSVGYSVDPSKIKSIGQGESDGTGESRVEGPASIVRGWQLMEISVVPVPADQDALLRRSVYAGQGRKGSAPMSLELSNIMPTGDAPPANPAPASPAPQPSRSLDEQVAERDRRLAEHRAATRSAIDGQIRAFCPPSVKDVGDECVLDGMELEAARAKIRAAYLARRAAPNGTPEPSAVKPLTPPNGEQNNPAHELTADTVLRALTGLRS